MLETTEEPISQKGVSFRDELFALTLKYIRQKIDVLELINILVHVTKVHACINIEGYYPLLGYLTCILNTDLEGLYDNTKKAKEEDAPDSMQPLRK